MPADGAKLAVWAGALPRICCSLPGASAPTPPSPALARRARPIKT